MPQDSQLALALESTLHAPLHREPKVQCDEKEIRDKLIKIGTVNKNTRGQLFVPFSIETTKLSSYLTLSLEENWQGLPLNPCRLSFKLTNFDELNHAVSFLFQMNFLYRGYVQKHELLKDKPEHELKWESPPKSNGEPTLAISSALDALLLQLGRKAFNTATKCLERLKIWDKNSICDFEANDTFYRVVAGQWTFVCPIKTMSNKLIHLCLLVMCAKVESIMDKEIKNRILLKEGIGQPDIKAMKSRYNHVDGEQMDRFKLLQKKIHLERTKYFPHIDIRKLKTPRPSQIFLSRCVHCGSVPSANFNGGNSQWHSATIVCPNKCEQPIIQEGEHERELHLAAINWERRNIEKLNLSQIYMWNLKGHAENHTLEQYLLEVREFLSDNVEYNKLTRTLPREVVKDKAGKGFARNVEINLLWAELFLEAFHMRKVVTG